MCQNYNYFVASFNHLSQGEWCRIISATLFLLGDIYRVLCT